MKRYFKFSKTYKEIDYLLMSGNILLKRRGGIGWIDNKIDFDKKIYTKNVTL